MLSGLDSQAQFGFSSTSSSWFTDKTGLNSSSGGKSNTRTYYVGGAPQRWSLRVSRRLRTVRPQAETYIAERNTPIARFVDVIRSANTQSETRGSASTIVLTLVLAWRAL